MRMGGISLLMRIFSWGEGRRGYMDQVWLYMISFRFRYRGMGASCCIRRLG